MKLRTAGAVGRRPSSERASGKSGFLLKVKPVQPHRVHPSRFTFHVSRFTSSLSLPLSPFCHLPSSTPCPPERSRRQSVLGDHSGERKKQNHQPRRPRRRRVIKALVERAPLQSSRGSPKPPIYFKK